MSSSVGVTIRQLSSNDVALMEAMMTTFGEAFDEVDTYTGPDRAHTILNAYSTVIISSL